MGRQLVGGGVLLATPREPQATPLQSPYPTCRPFWRSQIIVLVLGF
jgi:hypothetical protein